MISFTVLQTSLSVALEFYEQRFKIAFLGNSLAALQLGSGKVENFFPLSFYSASHAFQKCRADWYFMVERLRPLINS